MPRVQKFSEKSFWVISSRNRIEEGVGLEEEVDIPEQRGFWDRMDFHLGAMTQLTKRRREGERETSRKAPTQLVYQNIKN